MAAPRVIAVVVTYNRADMLVACVRALAAQTHPVAEVLIVDNASTDGSEERLAAAGAADGLEVTWVRLQRNGGGAEGFHYGVAHALERDGDWLWLMDDDCEPAPDCLERLLASRPAADPATAVVCPRVVAADGRLLPLNRLVRARRFVRSPLVPAPGQEGEARIDTASFVGPLIRSADARRAGLPLREVFIRFDDIEYVDRLGAGGARGVWNVGDAVIVHKEPVPLADVSLAGTLRALLRPREFASQWRHLYGVRNLIHAGRRHGWMTVPNALGLALQNVLVYLAFGERRLRLAALAVRYVADGLRGRFDNLAPADWARLADAPRPGRFLAEHRLRYDASTDGVPRPLAAGTPGARR